MNWDRARNRRWHNRGARGDKVMWAWGFLGIFLLIVIALMIASKDQPSNASLAIWSPDITAGQNTHSTIP